MTREKAIEILNEIIDEGWLISDFEKCVAIDACDMAIEALEQEPKTGHWIPMGLVDANDNRNYECSECHHGDTHAKNQIVPYCWYCGAKMEGVQE